MVKPEIEALFKIDPNKLSDDDFNLLIDSTKYQIPDATEDEWADCIIKVCEIYTNRVSLEQALKYVDDAYTEYFRIYPNAFSGRCKIQEYLCKLNLAAKNQKKAHEAMNKIVFISMSEIGFTSANNKMKYFSFRPFSDYSIKDIENETISLAHPREFNDPLDTILVYWLNRSIENQEHIDDVDLKYLLLLKKVSENIKLRCLIGAKYIENGTKKTREIEDLSFLMWSHYAKSHTGFCVEYKFDRKLFDNDTTEKKVQLIAEVSYPKVINVKDSPSFKKCLFEKSNFWEYEHEMRLAQFDTNPIEEGQNKDYPEIKCTNMIKAIYLGVNCSDKDKLRMIKAIGDKDIPLYQMEIDDSNLTRLRKVLIG